MGCFSSLNKNSENENGEETQPKFFLDDDDNEKDDFALNDLCFDNKDDDENWK